MHAPATNLDQYFSDQEIKQFEKEDIKAGSFLCSMLTVFFLYTLIVMAFSAWWTMNQVSQF